MWVMLHACGVGEGRYNMIVWHNNLFWSNVVLVADAWLHADSLLINIPFDTYCCLVLQPLWAPLDAVQG